MFILPSLCILARILWVSKMLWKSLDLHTEVIWRECTPLTKIQAKSFAEDSKNHIVRATVLQTDLVQFQKWISVFLQFGWACVWSFFSLFGGEQLAYSLLSPLCLVDWSVGQVCGQGPVPIARKPNYESPLSIEKRVQKHGRQSDEMNE